LIGYSVRRGLPKTAFGGILEITAYLGTGGVQMTDEIQDELQKNLDFYIKNQDEIVKRYDGRVLVLHKQQVAGDFDSLTDAYFTAKDRYAAGTFSIIKCSPGDKDYTVGYRTVHRFSRLACI
jgi:hypothetical protein